MGAADASRPALPGRRDTARLEARIAGLAGQGDLPAVAVAVLEAYGPEVRAYLRTLLLDREEADDAYSVFTVNVWKGIATWRRESSARTWAYRVAWNAASRFHRDPWRRRRVRMVTGAASRWPAPQVSSTARAREGRIELLAALRARLSPGERALLHLKVDRDLTWNEVSAALAGEGEAAAPAALRKRFERLTRKLARAAASLGLVEVP